MLNVYGATQMPPACVGQNKPRRLFDKNTDSTAYNTVSRSKGHRWCCIPTKRDLELPGPNTSLAMLEYRRLRQKESNEETDRTSNQEIKSHPPSH